MFKMKKCVYVFFLVGFVVQCSAMSLSELEDFANYLKKTSQLDETLKKGTDPNEFDEDESVSDHAWEESGKFEGDLILNERQRRMIVEEIAEGLSRNGLRDSTKRWPDNEVIYYIQKEHFSSDQVQAIQDGIDDLARASCVKFRSYRKGDRDAVVIQGSRRGCFSQVGYQGGYQVLNLSARHPVGRGCFRHGTVVHELLHTLGFYHMQSSPDRDDYVDIVWENIIQPARHNFRKYNAFSVSDFGVGYDYDSVLHYSKGAFSSNGQDTIVPKQSGADIGQRVGLSDKDTQKLNKMYCDADSNNDEEDIKPHKSPNKKKKPKNKPFEGHGIGYHQGKTVVIKLLPSAETYVMNKPALSMFHYFSKTPQALSTKEIEGFGPGRRIADFYKPTYKENDSYPTQKEVQNLSGLKTVYSNGKGYGAKDHATKEENPKEENSVQEKNNINSKNNEKPSSSENDDELNDAFRRLAKILKTHVYPNHVPDLKAYKVNTDYSEFGDPDKVPKIAYDFVPTLPKKYNDERKSAESEYIKKLYQDTPVSLRQQTHDYGTISDDNDTRSKYIGSHYDIEHRSNLVNPKQKATENNNNISSSENNINSKIKDNSDKNNHELLKKTASKIDTPKEIYDDRLPHRKNVVPNEGEASYRTSYPLKTLTVVSNGSLEYKTPDYALYENLKDKNNYTGLYLPYTQDDDDGQYKIFGDSVPTYDKWYQKDYLKRNPVDYDRPSFSYVYPNSKSGISVYDDPEGLENESSHESAHTRSFSPRTKQAYTLYGELVPLTQNWYKIKRSSR